MTELEEARAAVAFAAVCKSEGVTPNKQEISTMREAVNGAADGGNNAMSEAMAKAGVEGKVQLAEPKVQPGVAVVAVQLTRDETKSGRFMEAISKGWQPTGCAMAIKDGHLVASNFIFGRWTNGVPKISACHIVTCKKCGKRLIMPLAVWEAKDLARRNGAKEKLDDLSGYELLRRYGSCSCGGKWGEDNDAEKEELSKFSDFVLRSIESSGRIPKFIPPRAFTIHAPEDAVPLEEDWTWLEQAMSGTGRSAIPFEQNGKGDCILFNPGFWLGTVDDPFATGLFFDPGFRSKGASRGFNPHDLTSIGL